jgi:hypothetical protein
LFSSRALRADPSPRKLSPETLGSTPAANEFSYFGAADQDTQPRWRDRWQNASNLPLRVHVTFPPDDWRKWPDLVIAPAIISPIGTGSISQGAGGRAF